MMKIRLLADYWQQRQYDADGVMFYVRRVKGDVFEVNEPEARHLLREGHLIKPMAVKVESQSVQQVSRPSPNTAKK